MSNTITEEFYDVCSLCGGRGQEYSQPGPMSTSAVSLTSCRQCRGTGQVVTRRIIRHEEMNSDELSNAIEREMRKVMQKFPTMVINAMKHFGRK